MRRAPNCAKIREAAPSVSHKAEIRDDPARQAGCGRTYVLPWEKRERRQDGRINREGPGIIRPPHNFSHSVNCGSGVSRAGSEVWASHRGTRRAVKSVEGNLGQKGSHEERRLVELDLQPGQRRSLRERGAGGESMFPASRRARPWWLSRCRGNKCS
eukprot:545900-Pleurochrysis_carterae.AAC.4